MYPYLSQTRNQCNELHLKGGDATTWTQLSGYIISNELWRVWWNKEDDEKREKEENEKRKKHNFFLRVIIQL